MNDVLLAIGEHFVFALSADDHSFGSLIRIHGQNGIWVVWASAAFAVVEACAHETSVLHHTHLDFGSGLVAHLCVRKRVCSMVVTALCEDASLRLPFLGCQAKTVQRDTHTASVYYVSLWESRHDASLSLGWKNDQQSVTLEFFSGVVKGLELAICIELL